MAQGIIYSPNYPQNYDSNEHCEWLLRTEPSHSISLRFTDFDLETTTNCTDDWVKVYDGSQKNEQKLLSTLCGTELPSALFKSVNNELLIVMESDTQYEAKGFSAFYKTASSATWIIYITRKYLFTRIFFSYKYYAGLRLTNHHLKHWDPRNRTQCEMGGRGMRMDSNS